MSVDIAGQRFGRLIAKEKVIINGITKWRCECDCGNKKFYATVKALNSGNTKSCGCIKSFGEAKIQSILEELNIDFIREYTFSDLKGKNNKGYLRFDFYLPQYNILIEYDGEQHFFSKNCGWNNQESLRRIQENDIIKNNYCKEHNIFLIRIPYTEFNNITIDYIKNKIYNTC